MLVPVRISVGLRRCNGGTCRLYQLKVDVDMLTAVILAKVSSVSPSPR